MMQTVNQHYSLMRFAQHFLPVKGQIDKWRPISLTLSEPIDLAWGLISQLSKSRDLELDLKL